MGARHKLKTNKLLRFEWVASDNLILKLLQLFPIINLEPLSNAVLVNYEQLWPLSRD